MEFYLDEKAIEDYKFWSRTNPAIKKKIDNLLDELLAVDTKPRKGKPEILRGSRGLVSLHIDKGNRLVYYIKDKTAIILSCKGHYESVKTRR